MRRKIVAVAVAVLSLSFVAGNASVQAGIVDSNGSLGALNISSGSTVNINTDSMTFFLVWNNLPGASSFRHRRQRSDI